MLIQVHVKLLSRFVIYGHSLDEDGCFRVPEGSTALDLAEALGIPSRFVVILLINGRQKRPHTVLEHGDTIVYVPPAVGGG